MDAGADAASRSTFNADAYFRYLDEVRALGIGVPVVPGIMPITNSSQLLRFSDARRRGTALDPHAAHGLGDDAAGIRPRRRRGGRAV